ncbi:DNA transformation protein [Rhizobium subbaraonis]|uniref:DNA transformation protein n=1 Tax=Rhizobium subbaraonis TaxID=908946 RepID=A0A285UPI1_9HYPH|nr:TfoX/Sxy family protein [Rhizobium subbaraonis]SOC42556.1 DNA transformation protein [Rhizobium subbaraonis]
MDNDAIEEMFQSLGPVTIKRMFGGKGIYAGDLIVALEVDGEVLLKADEVTIPEFELSGSRQWVYSGKKTGAPLRMPYWSIPEDAFDDPDLMAEWVKLALEAAIRANSSKR